MSKVLIIAEAGVNHNGNLNLAYKMIDEAKAAGADIIKFQTGKPENIISRFAEKAAYQKETTGSQESQLDMVRKIMLPFNEFIYLKEYCEKVDIQFLTTPFDIESIHFVNDLVSFWKIPSGEVTNLLYLVEIAKTRKPIIMSTGMCDLIEIQNAIRILKENGAGSISLLHCNTQYPTPYNDVNLNAMLSLRKEFGVQIGYSDHTSGIEIPIAAVAMGATIIEKHFTLDKNMDGPDHKASIVPQELKVMIDSIRHVELAMGNGIKQASESEISNKSIVRKSIVAKTNIKKGETLSENNITTKRPGTGISPMQWFNVVGTKAIRNFFEDELIEI